MLIQVEGTPLHGVDKIEALQFVRTIAVARIIMPASYVRLSAGRTEMSDETQALCFLAGANSIFYGDKLLTTDNPDENHDQRLFDKLGINKSHGQLTTEIIEQTLSQEAGKQSTCGC
jgi:biotin synthase